jgi:hypothetical protein
MEAGRPPLARLKAETAFKRSQAVESLSVDPLASCSQAQRPTADGRRRQKASK